MTAEDDDARSAVLYVAAERAREETQRLWAEKVLQVKSYLAATSAAGVLLGAGFVEQRCSMAGVERQIEEVRDRASAAEERVAQAETKIAGIERSATDAVTLVTTAKELVASARREAEASASRTHEVVQSSLDLLGRSSATFGTAQEEFTRTKTILNDSKVLLRTSETALERFERLARDLERTTEGAEERLRRLEDRHSSLTAAQEQFATSLGATVALRTESAINFEMLGVVESDVKTEVRPFWIRLSVGLVREETRLEWRVHPVGDESATESGIALLRESQKGVETVLDPFPLGRTPFCGEAQLVYHDWLAGDFVVLRIGSCRAVRLRG